MSVTDDDNANPGPSIERDMILADLEKHHDEFSSAKANLLEVRNVLRKRTPHGLLLKYCCPTSCPSSRRRTRRLKMNMKLMPRSKKTFTSLSSGASMIPTSVSLNSRSQSSGVSAHASRHWLRPVHGGVIN